MGPLTDTAQTPEQESGSPATSAGAEFDETPVTTTIAAPAVDVEAERRTSAFPEDGRVSVAELEQAFFAAIDCVEQEGIEVTDAELESDGSTSWTSYVPGSTDGDAGLAVGDACFQQHFNPIDSAWSAVGLINASEFDERRAAVRACLMGLGYASDDVEFGAYGSASTSDILSCGELS